MSIRRIVTAFVLATCLAGGAHAQQPTEVRRVEGIVEYALPNGLAVLLRHDASKPTTTVNLTYRVGSRHEGYGESGAAHLLEHLLFKASETVEDPKLEMTRRGARWNGTTWNDRTNYFAQFASDPETLDWMLRWLAESMTKAKLAKADLDTEMTVVRNELERAENNPGRILSGRMRGAAYQWHAYGRDTLGARSDVEQVPIERLRAFYRKHYRPDNAVLVIGGNFDASAVLAKVQQAFGGIAKPTEPLEATWTREPPQDGERQVTLRRLGGHSSVGLLYHVMPAHQREFAAVRVLAQLLGSPEGPVGRDLVDSGVAATSWGYANPGQEPGFLVFGVGLGDASGGEAKAQEALQRLVKLAEGLQVQPLQVQLARQRVLQDAEATLRDPETLSLALSEAIALGDWRLLFAMRDWVEAVQPADVQAVARQFLVASNRTAGLYLAEARPPVRPPVPTVVPVAQLLKDYRGRVLQAAVEDFEPIPANIEARTAKGQLAVAGAPGLRYAVLPRRAPGDRVHGTLRLRWGTAESVHGSAVLATLLGPLLTQGTATKSSEAVSQWLLSLEAQLRISSGSGGLTANFDLPARHVEAFLAGLGELLQHSSFPEVAFERARNVALANVATSQADPAAVAGNALQQVFSARYAPGDPRHARTPEQSRQLLQAATPAQLREFWRRFGGAGHGELALVGPVQPAQVQAWAQKAFGDWRSPELHRPWVFEYPEDLKGRAQAVHVPDKSNANYVARIPLDLHEDDPQYPALFVAVNMLGGRAGTALWQRVREQEGLSYGVGANLFAPAGPRQEGRAGAININASFAPENSARLRAAIRDELKQRAESGFNDLQVGFARRAIVSSRAAWLAQPANVASLLAGNLRWDRDALRYAKFTEAFDKLDARAVNAALKARLDLDRMVEVEAGTFKAP